MNPQTRPRSRGAKAILTRDAIATAALTALATGGPEGLTMRKVAALLDTGPSSLYAHVKNLEHLQGLVLDDMSAAIALAPAASTADPIGAIVTLMQSYATALREHPGTAAIALVTPPVGSGFLDFAETFAGTLQKLGIGDAETIGAFDKLVLLVTATVAEQEASSRADPTISIGDRYAAALAAQPADAPARPLLNSLLTTGHPTHDDITWSVTTFLRGLTSR